MNTNSANTSMTDSVCLGVVAFRPNLEKWPPTSLSSRRELQSRMACTVQSRWRNDSVFVTVPVYETAAVLFLWHHRIFYGCWYSQKLVINEFWTNGSRMRSAPTTDTFSPPTTTTWTAAANLSRSGHAYIYIYISSQPNDQNEFKYIFTRTIYRIHFACALFSFRFFFTWSIRCKYHNNLFVFY